MSGQVEARKTPWLKGWIAIRFVIFGVGGFWVMGIGCGLLGPIYGFPVVFIGGLMMLYGSGMWGRWAYLWVFFSTPLVIMMMIAVDLYLPRWERYVPFNKGSLILLLIVPMPLSYWGVKKYYKQREETVSASPAESQFVNDREVSR